MFGKEEEKKETQNATDEDTLEKLAEAKKKAVIEKEIEVQGMPKEFRDYNPITGNSRLAGLAIVALSFVFLIGVSFGVYFYILKPYFLRDTAGLNNKQIEVLQTAPDIQPTELPKTSEESVVDTPLGVYTKYAQALSMSIDFEVYNQAVMLYGSKNRISKLSIEKTTWQNNFSSWQEFLSNQFIDPLKAEEEERDNDTQFSLLFYQPSVGTQERKLLFVVRLVKEENEWKVDEVVKQEEENSGVKATASADRDNDGLSDVEEDLLGSDKDIADSDNDGYSDAEETEKLYNPAGKDKLIDSPRISQYLNDVFNYSIIYPNSWEKEINSGKDSVIFRGPKNQFVQIYVIPNESGISVDSWYKNNFNVSTIDSEQVVGSGNWRGIRTGDRLYTYIQSPKSKSIFVLQYNPSATNVLDYIHLFSAMVNSFTIR